MKSPLVSIITPFFNDATTLSDTIQSVRAQDFSDWELILIDDASMDQSRNIAVQGAQKDSRIRPIRLQQNGGAARSRNEGIRQATGRYIAFLDADDLWSSEKLSRQLAFMEERSIVLSCTSYELISENGTRTGKIVSPPDELSYAMMLTKNYIGCLTAMYDTNVAGKVFMPDLRKRQDYGLWLRIIKENGPALSISEPLAYYRKRRSSVSSNKLEMIRYNWRLMHEIEGLNRFSSAWYVSRQVINRILS